MVKLSYPFCCEGLQAIIESADAPIEYEPRTREFVLVIPKSCLKPPDTCRMAFSISHCPRCGQAFPPPLDNEWERLVERTYGILEWPIDQKQLNRLPKELRTDEWWKKRGL